MKFFGILLLLSFSTGAFAAVDRSIYDLMYLPKARTSYGITEGLLYNGKIERDDAKTDIGGYTVSQTLGHSITDQLLVSATMNWSSIRYSPSDTRTITSEGASDPTFTGRYRLAEDAQLIFDVLASGTVSTGDQTFESNGDYNNKRGGSSVQVGAQFGQKSQVFQWALSGFFNRNFSATVKQQSGSKVDLNAYNSYTVQYDALKRLTEHAYLKGTFSVDVVDGYKGDNGTKYESMNIVTGGGEYQYMYTSNLLLRGGLHISEYMNTGDKQRDNWIFNVGANYQF